MPYRHLSFSLTVAEREAEYDEQRHYLEVAVRALIDGNSPYEQADHEDVFSALDILIQGTEAGTLDIFTCSCGVAGCAGIHYDCKLEVDEKAVRWKFPEAPFRKRLAHRLRPAGEPMTVEFERAQYEQALAELHRDLEVLTAGRPHAWAVAPASGPYSREDSETFGQFLAGCKVRAREYAEAQAVTAAAEGELRQLALQTTLPNGDVLEANLGRIAWELVPEDVEDRSAYVGAIIRPALLADPVGVFLRDVSPEDWSELFWRAKAGSEATWVYEWPTHFAGQFQFVVVPDVDVDDGF